MSDTRTTLPFTTKIHDSAGVEIKFYMEEEELENGEFKATLYKEGTPKKRLGFVSYQIQEDHIHITNMHRDFGVNEKDVGKALCEFIFRESLRNWLDGHVEVETADPLITGFYYDEGFRFESEYDKKTHVFHNSNQIYQLADRSLKYLASQSGELKNDYEELVKIFTVKDKGTPGYDDYIKTLESYNITEKEVNTIIQVYKAVCKVERVNIDSDFINKGIYYSANAQTDYLRKNQQSPLVVGKLELSSDAIKKQMVDIKNNPEQVKYSKLAKRTFGVASSRRAAAPEPQAVISEPKKIIPESEEQPGTTKAKIDTETSNINKKIEDLLQVKDWEGALNNVKNEIEIFNKQCEKQIQIMKDENQYTDTDNPIFTNLRNVDDKIDALKKALSKYQSLKPTYCTAQTINEIAALVACINALMCSSISAYEGSRTVSIVYFGECKREVSKDFSIEADPTFSCLKELEKAFQATFPIIQTKETMKYREYRTPKEKVGILALTDFLETKPIISALSDIVTECDSYLIHLLSRAGFSKDDINRIQTNNMLLSNDDFTKLGFKTPSLDDKGKAKLESIEQVLNLNSNQQPPTGSEFEKGTVPSKIRVILEIRAAAKDKTKDPERALKACEAILIDQGNLLKERRPVFFTRKDLFATLMTIIHKALRRKVIGAEFVENIETKIADAKNTLKR